LSLGLIKGKNNVQRKTKELFKRGVAIFMLALLMTSFAIKTADSCFHEHYNETCNKQNGYYLHQYHEKCAVHSFEFSLLLLKNSIKSIPVIVNFDCFSIHYRSRSFSKQLNHSSLFRAPPFQENFSL